MSPSFWFSLFVCIVAFFSALIDHRETVEDFRGAATPREKRWHIFKLWVFWGVFVIALGSVLVSWNESVTSSQEKRQQGIAMSNATDKIAKLTLNLTNATNDLARLASKTHPQILMYTNNPNSENIKPEMTNSPAQAYSKNGDAPTYTWNIKSQSWQ